jgi:hypothetical protein
MIQNLFRVDSIFVNFFNLFDEATLRVIYLRNNLSASPRINQETHSSEQLIEHFGFPMNIVARIGR